MEMMAEILLRAATDGVHSQSKEKPKTPDQNWDGEDRAAGTIMQPTYGFVDKYRLDR